jgi:DNA-binding response OmpR family regulator
MVFGHAKRVITRLLVCEDEPLIAFDNEHALIEQGFEVVATVDRVADAIAVLVSGVDVHLVLVDITLADGSGIEVARAAHARWSSSLANAPKGVAPLPAAASPNPIARPT